MEREVGRTCVEQKAGFVEKRRVGAVVCDCGRCCTRATAEGRRNNAGQQSRYQRRYYDPLLHRFRCLLDFVLFSERDAGVLSPSLAGRSWQFSCHKKLRSYHSRRYCAAYVALDGIGRSMSESSLEMRQRISHTINDILADGSRHEETLFDDFKLVLLG